MNCGSPDCGHFSIVRFTCHQYPQCCCLLSDVSAVCTQAQTGNVSVREFFRQKGLRGIYQGASVTIWRDVAFNMAFFTSRQGLISLYCRQFNHEPIDSAKFALGVMSGKRTMM